MIIRIIILLVLLCGSALAADSLTITLPSDAPQAITLPSDAPQAMSYIRPGINPEQPYGWRLSAPDIAPGPDGSATLPPDGMPDHDVTTAGYSMIIMAGADYAMPMQAVGAGFDTDWPQADFYPSGSMPVAFATIIENAGTALWTIRLSSSQTEGLSGKIGVIQLRLPNGSGIYTVFAVIPAIVRPTVTR